MTDNNDPQFPHYPPVTGHQFAHPKQSGFLLKTMKNLMKFPKQKVLRTRNKTVKKKFRIV